MATVSKSLSGLSPVQRKGFVLTVVGLLVFVSFPLVRLATFTPPSGPQFGFMIISPYGACLLIWGIYVLRTGKPRPLTPRRVLLIPLLTIMIFAVVDVLTRGELFQLWEYVGRSWAHLHIGSLARYVPFASHIGASTFVVVGAAVRMRRRRVLLASLGLVLFVYSFIFLNNTLFQTVVGQTLLGIVPFVIGYRATQPPGDSSKE